MSQSTRSVSIGPQFSQLKTLLQTNPEIASLMITNQWPSVCVITPTVGKLVLARAINSVSEQVYPGSMTHLVVVDGEEYSFKTDTVLGTNKPPGFPNPKYSLRTTVLPFNTGANGFYGHRIYAGFAHMMKDDIILFLDEDNYYSPDHIVSLVLLMKDQGLDWAYSLRSIADKEGIVQIQDNCESLGKYGDIWCQPGNHLVDTSSYAFTRPFLEMVGHVWHSGWGGDRRFYKVITENLQSKFDCTGCHSVIYCLDGNPGSVTLDFFRQGMQHTVKKYPGTYVFPWHTNNAKIAQLINLILSLNP